MGLALLACLLLQEQADPKAVEAAGHLQQRHAELLRLLHERSGEGLHGPFHQRREDLERELWALLESLPRRPESARILLASIDGIYLKFYANGYHGWEWHHPYFDCRKAVILAERLLRDHPAQAEEALWTKLYCHRLRGLAADEAAGGYQTASVLAMRAWKADAAKARETAKELLEKFQKGPYAARVTEWLKLGDEELILPKNHGYAHPFARGEAGK